MPISRQLLRDLGVRIGDRVRVVEEDGEFCFTVRTVSEASGRLTSINHSFANENIREIEVVERARPTKPGFYVAPVYGEVIWALDSGGTWRQVWRDGTTAKVEASAVPTTVVPITVHEKGC